MIKTVKMFISTWLTLMIHASGMCIWASSLWPSSSWLGSNHINEIEKQKRRVVAGCSSKIRGTPLPFRP